MKLLSLLAILCLSQQAAALISSSPDFIQSWGIALVAVLMFSFGLVFLVGSLRRWHAVRKQRRHLPGWHRG